MNKPNEKKIPILIHLDPKQVAMLDEIAKREKRKRKTQSEYMLVQLLQPAQRQASA